MGVRDRYLDHEAVTAELLSWEREFPELVKVKSLGKTPEGRDIWCAALGVEPERPRPAMFVNAGQHAGELVGTNVALALGRALLALLSHPHDPEIPTYGLPRSCLPDLRHMLLYLVPRVSPDGAERVLRDGRTVRSVPRPRRQGSPATRWESQDIDGDGQIRWIRKQDPLGDFVESKVAPGLLVARELGDEGPYYKVWPEGIIEGFDGVHVPSPRYLSDNYPDLNRNFPFDWKPEPDQVGAGEYPGSEPESRALIEFATRSPHLFAWIDYHTFGGVFIRPLGAGPDTKLDPADLAFYRQLEVWASQLTGYPMVSGYEQFTYEPDMPLRGDLTEYAYHQRGTVAFVVELWDLFERAGLPKQKRFVDRYTHLDREDMEKIALWARDHADAQWLVPWKPLEHPQLGKVEVGGPDSRFVVWNPPPRYISELCDQQLGMALRLLATAPQLELVDPEVVVLGPELRRVELTVRNRGYLSTSVVAPARKAAHHQPMTVEVTGCRVLSPQGPITIEELAGWGRGRHGGDTLSMVSPGNLGMRRIQLLVQGAGTLSVRVGSPRMGYETLRIELP
jgi:hypothetical protein